MAQFIPRTVFPAQLSLPRSYFLGHHAAGLKNMKTMISHIDLIIECRDYRVPLTSRNPLFEQLLQGRERLVVYTKRDLGVGSGKKKGVVDVEVYNLSFFFCALGFLVVDKNELPCADFMV